jgi:hypothetical protein
MTFLELRRLGSASVPGSVGKIQKKDSEQDGRRRLTAQLSPVGTEPGKKRFKIDGSNNPPDSTISQKNN